MPKRLGKLSDLTIQKLLLKNGFFRSQESAAKTNSETLQLSSKVRELFQQGKSREAMDFHYEDLVRHVTGGQSKVVNGREIDSVTDEALIQAKRSKAANQNPRFFINRVNPQIISTIDSAREQGKRAEFWFKYGAHSQVRLYIEQMGGIVKTGLGEHTPKPEPNLNQQSWYRPAV